MPGESAAAAETQEVFIDEELQRSYLLWVFGGPKVDEIYELSPDQLTAAGELLAERYSQIPQPKRSEAAALADSFIVERSMTGAPKEHIAEELGITTPAVTNRFYATSQLLQRSLSDEEREELLTTIIHLPKESPLDEIEARPTPLPAEEVIEVMERPKAQGRAQQRSIRNIEDPEADILRRYLLEIGQNPLLTKDDEVRLAKIIEAGRAAKERLEEPGKIPLKQRRELMAEIEAGDQAAKEFISANLRLVVAVAKKYFMGPRALPLLDRIQEGNLGLMHAVEKFDWRKGFKFSTYATWWIRQAITRGIVNTGRPIRLPVQVNERVALFHKTREAMEIELGRAPTVAEIAIRAAISEDKVKEAARVGGAILSLDEPLGEDADDLLGDIVPDVKSGADIDKALNHVAMVGLVDRIAETLDPLEMYVLRQRWGLDDGERRTLDEVGKELGVKPLRIRQIESRAMSKTRHPSAGINADDVLH